MKARMKQCRLASLALNASTTIIMGYIKTCGLIQLASTTVTYLDYFLQHAKFNMWRHAANVNQFSGWSGFLRKNPNQVPL